jgi:hypothetical protein
MVLRTGTVAASAFETIVWSWVILLVPPPRREVRPPVLPSRRFSASAAEGGLATGAASESVADEAAQMEARRGMKRMASMEGLEGLRVEGGKAQE